MADAITTGRERITKRLVNGASMHGWSSWNGVHRANGAACQPFGYCSESRGERLVQLIWDTQAGNMGKLELLSCAYCRSNPLLSKGGDFGPNAMLSSP